MHMVVCGGQTHRQSWVMNTFLIPLDYADNLDKTDNKYRMNFLARCTALPISYYFYFLEQNLNSASLKKFGSH